LQYRYCCYWLIFLSTSPKMKIRTLWSNIILELFCKQWFCLLLEMVSKFTSQPSLHSFHPCGGVAQLIERRTNNRKVAKPRYEFPCDSALLYPGGPSCIPVVVV